MIGVFMIAAFAYRFAMLAISIRHERALRAGGARELGAANTRWLTVAHIAFYVVASIEGVIHAAAPDALSVCGLALHLFGAAMLLVVVRLLGRFWTVKLLIAPDHVLVTNALFRAVRHPNYYLNILPELAGYALALHAFATLVIGLGIYLVPLTTRIRQEEAAMREAFPAY